jgi:probable HAF family extracellular repeat protein
VKTSPKKTFFAGLALLSCVPNCVLNWAPHAWAAEWRLVDLGPALVRPSGLSNTGVIVGAIYRFDPGIGVQQVLEPASGLIRQAQLADVNDSGAAVGFRLQQVNGPGSQCPLQRFGIGAPISAVFAIRNDGGVSGSCETICSLPLLSFRDSFACALIGGVERSFGFSERELPPRDGALALNSSGEAVGYALKKIGSAHVERGFFFDPAANGGVGAIVDLGTFGGLNSRATDINDSGRIVGRADIDQGAFPRYHAFVSNRAQGIQDIGSLGENSAANAVNSAGTVVGDYDFNSRTKARAFIFDLANGTRDLNTVLPVPEGWELVAATDVNDLGEIVGSAHINGALHGFFYTSRDLSTGGGGGGGGGGETLKRVALKLQATGDCKKRLKQRKNIKKGTRCTFQSDTMDEAKTPLPGVSYQIQRSSKRNGPWAPVVSAQSDSTGKAKHKVKLKKSSYLRAAFSVGLANESSSNTVRLPVK